MFVSMICVYIFALYMFNHIWLLTSHYLEIIDWGFGSVWCNSHMDKSYSEIKGSFSWAGKTVFDEKDWLIDFEH